MAIQEYTPLPATDRQPLRMRDIAWLAGLMEGEGSFQMRSSPVMTIDMTDYDIIERVSHLTEYGITTYKPRGKATYKQVWGVRLAGARAAAWMMTLYPFLGARRQANIGDILRRWRQAPSFPRGRRGERLPALCHPERVRRAEGLCAQCYQKQYMQRYRRKEQQTTYAMCHPDRLHWGHGLCSPCYQRAYRLRKKQSRTIQQAFDF